MIQRPLPVGESNRGFHNAALTPIPKKFCNSLRNDEVLQGTTGEYQYSPYTMDKLIWSGVYNTGVKFQKRRLVAGDGNCSDGRFSDRAFGIDSVQL